MLQASRQRRRGRAGIGSNLAERVDVVRVPIACVLTTSACVPAVKRTGGPPSPAQMAELWVDRGSAARDLFEGQLGTLREPPRPQADTRYDILNRDTRGFSITYRVPDGRGREWHIKIEPEAQTEVVTSRIVWALGYHQLPSSFVE